MNKTSRNLAFSFKTAVSLTIAVVVLGLAATHFASPVLFGIVFVSATFLAYTKLAAIFVFFVSMITSMFSKSKADTELKALTPRIPDEAVEDSLQKMAKAANALQSLTPEEMQSLLSEMMSRQSANPAKPSTKK